MGPSGSGKSTLLHCIAGIDRPDEGAIEIGGESLAGLDESGLCRLRRESVSSVFQFFHLLPTLSARENVEFPLQLNGVPPAERKARVDALIEEVGLSHRADAMPHELSGGEMQRVAIARALVIEPRLILADEPTGNLDSATGAQVIELLFSMNRDRGTTLVLVTHDEQLATRCDRRIAISAGIVAA
jgi:predicted ABC-type transport system involved in lysophospholipase L1 biosynthesis ATPase subunit